MVIVLRSASDKLAVDSLVCIVRLLVCGRRLYIPPKRVVSGKSLRIKDL